MKKAVLTFVGIVLAVLMTGTMLAGCFGSGESGKQEEDVSYTIQYMDDAGSHTITVKYGETYSLETLPQRTGYDFTGLFDAKVGGTQYVDETGQSLSAFTDKKNIVLFPQFRAKEYTVILDYQGAAVTGERSVTVEYGKTLPELPKNLALEHSTFAGWYTAENCGGVQIADAYGLIPDKSVLTEKIFDISDDNGYIYLYAGFDAETFKVTFIFGSGKPSEEMEVEYNTPISEVVPETRDEKGYAVLSWSKTSNGSQIFTGNVTDNMVLYAAEWAPVIQLNANGGNVMAPIVAKSGTTVSLPKAERENYKFLYWVNADGEETDITKMPLESVTLKAEWQAMLVFDENGGTEVKDISESAGTAVTLPSSEKEGFIFAGWYTQDKEIYSASKMPSASIELKAGWYKSKSVLNTFLEEGDESSLVCWGTPEFESSYRINFQELIPEVDWTKTINVSLNFVADFRHAKTKDQFQEFPTYATKEHFYFYTQEQISDAYLVGKCLADHGNGYVNESYTTTEFSITLPVSGGIIYTALGADKDNYYKQYGRIRCGSGWKMTNFWVEIEYPDTSNLYL